MRKAKVVAIVCGMIASCLFGGFAVVEAATITLDESSADLVVYVQPTTDDYEPQETTVATTVTSIATTTTAESRITTVNYLATAAAKNTTAVQTLTTAAVKATEPAEEVTGTTKAPAETEATTTIAKNHAAPRLTTIAQTTTTTTTTTTTVATAAPTAAVIATEAPTTAPVQIETALFAEDVTNPPMPTEAELLVAASEPAFEIPEPTMLEVPTEMPTEAPADVAPVQPDSNAISVSESDYILLCNAVAHEAGANSISAVDKAKVVEVIMNRVNSSKYPNTIYEVLTQKYQFTGSSTYVNLGSFSGKVTDLVREAVDMYLADPTQFSEGYLSFHGDGVRNYFN